MDDNESGYFDTRRAAAYLGLPHRTLDSYRVGTDPETGLALTLRRGRYGRFVQRGEPTIADAVLDRVVHNA